MKIISDFRGGNIHTISIENDTVYLDVDMRDSSGEWFYWAFAVEGAAGRTLHFVFPKNRVGYYGPAVSHDLISWGWLGKKDGEDEFSYTFGAGEDTVYFAHHLLYPEKRFKELAESYSMKISTLCKSNRGRDVPLAEWGSGGEVILFTARHHACESTGSYVLEGVLEELMNSPIDGFRLAAVPFVDYDGYLDGDQGKNRAPHDHNRDYPKDGEAIYPETAAIRALANELRPRFAFDFHSPWHKGDEHDNVFFVQKGKVENLAKLAKILEGTIDSESLCYDSKDDIPAGVGWNKTGLPTFACYMLDVMDCEIATTLETAYFGKEGNRVTAEKLVGLGRCFGKALKKYINGD